eukprot:126045-Rhodomonas_salina.3
MDTVAAFCIVSVRRRAGRGAVVVGAAAAADDEAAGRAGREGAGQGAALQAFRARGSALQKRSQLHRRRHTFGCANGVSRLQPPHGQAAHR